MYRKPTVMVVDDDPILRSLTTGILRNAEYDVVAECSSGEAALKQIPEIKPGLVLLDINLPDSDGITLIDMIQAVGNPVKLYGLNSVGLQRSGFSDVTVSELKKAYRLFFRSDINVSQARERATAELQPFPEVQAFIAFVEQSGRGIVT